MISIIQETKLIHVKCFASKTFVSLSSNDKKVESLHQTFSKTLETLGVTIYGLYGQGMDIMESLVASNNISDNLNLPNSNDAVTLRVIGPHIFLFIFKKTPQIIHITSPEF
jgi:hypothetical protein